MKRAAIVAAAATLCCACEYSGTDGAVSLDAGLVDGATSDQSSGDSGDSGLAEAGECHAVDPRPAGRGRCAFTTPDEYVKEAIEAYCFMQVDCGSWAKSQLADCIKTEEGWLDSRHWGYWLPRDSLAKGRVWFDAEVACDCIRRYRESGVCEDAPDGGDGMCWVADGTRHAVTGYRPVFPARVPLGGDCDNSFECADGWCSCGGKCVAFLDRGAPCGPLDPFVCGPGSYCDNDQRTCKARIAEGSPCASSDPDPCEEGLSCRPKGCGGTWVCGRPPSDGEVCAVLGASPCKWGLTCAPSASACPGLDDVWVCEPPVGLGCPCSIVSACARGFACVFPPHSQQGTCLPWKDVGAPCYSKTLDACPYWAGCDDTGHCEPGHGLEEGDPCPGVAYCDQNLYCDSGGSLQCPGICRKRPLLGEPCPGTSCENPCLEGWCNGVCIHSPCTDDSSC